MKKLGFLLLVSVLAGVPMALLSAYVVLDISRLFEIPVLSQMSPSQLYGLTVVVYLLITSTRKDPDNQMDLSDPYPKIFGQLTSIYVTRISTVLIAWGTTYLMWLVFSLLG